MGSLGKEDGEEDVWGLVIKNCTVKGTTNGVRIKTWPGSPPSRASNITFQDITMDDVANPIIIDQQYCPHDHCGSDADKVRTQPDRWLIDEARPLAVNQLVRSEDTHTHTDTHD